MNKSVNKSTLNLVVRNLHLLCIVSLVIHSQLVHPPQQADKMSGSLGAAVFSDTSYIYMFQLEDNCFTMLCWFLLHSNVNHQRAWNLVPYIIQLLPSNDCFTHGGIFVSAVLSVHPTPSCPHCVHKSLLYICVSIPAMQ